MDKTLTPVEEMGAEKPKGFWSSRYTLCLMAFLGIVIALIVRVDLTVAIVVMVNGTVSGDDEVNSTGTQCPNDFLEDDSNDEVEEGEFNWDAQTQGWILGSFSMGYVTTMFVGGVLSEKYGGKWVFGLGICLSSFFGLLSPIAAKTSPYLLIAVRALQGACQGPLFPSLFALAKYWFPKEERNRLMTFSQAGAQVGTILGFPLGGLLAGTLGWEVVFYTTGSLGVFWFLAFAFLCYSTPDEHPRISAEERAYINANVEADTRAGDLPFPPIRRIITSPVVLALTAAHVSNGWGYYTLLSSTPTYLKNIQHFPIEANGFLSALPHLLMYLMSFVVGFAADKLINTNKLTKAQVRKIFNTISHYGGACGLILLAFSNCDRIMAISALCIATGLNSGIYVGFTMNYVDLSPNFAATMMAINQTLSNCSGFISPAVTAMIIGGEQTIESWRIVFLTSAIVYVVGNTIFVLFGKADVQPWNTYWENKPEKEEEKNV